MKLTQLAVTAALAASAAFASDHLAQMRDQAGKLGRAFRDIGVMVEKKNFNTEEVQNRVNMVDADIESLKRLASEFEGANPSLAANSNKDWKLAKDLVHLIDIFHEQKSEILRGDPKKQRSLLRGHAKGLARRAFMLQETSDRLLRAGS